MKSNRVMYYTLLGALVVIGALWYFGVDPLGATGVSMAMAAAARTTVESVTKLTMKTMNAQPSMEELAKLEKKTGAENYLALARVVGIAKKFRPGEVDGKPYVRFAGQFKGTNLRDKSEYTSGAAIFPKMIEEQLWAVMGGEEVNDVQFAFEIGCKFDASAATKYVYTARALTKPAENDPLVLLERQVAQAALPAPK